MEQIIYCHGFLGIFSVLKQFYTSFHLASLVWDYHISISKTSILDVDPCFLLEGFCLETAGTPLLQRSSHTELWPLLDTVRNIFVLLHKKVIQPRSQDHYDRQSTICVVLLPKYFKIFQPCFYVPGLLVVLNNCINSTEKITISCGSDLMILFSE